MIQFNLLPDVKLEFIRTRRRKRTIASLSTVVTAGAVGLLVFMFLIANVWQKVTLNSLDKDIKSNSKKLQDTQDVNKILTIQNQLKSLPELHAQKPVASRLFGYLSQMTPSSINISQIHVNFDEHTIQLTGGADKLETVNKFVDTIKFTTFTTNANTTAQKAFSGVALTNYGRDDKSASYVIDVTFDPAIFASSSEGIAVIVPKTITTRSETERPADLFVTPAPAPAPAGAAR